MNNSSYSLFYNRNFIDCTLYQFGWEICDPAHSFGPAVRNHYLFHFITAGRGILYSTNQKGETLKYALKAGEGFLICPDQKNTYVADDRSPWEYAWLEFDGLKAREFLSLAGLSFDHPIYISDNPAMAQIMTEEMLYITHHGKETPLNLIGHLYLFFDALMKSSKSRMTLTGGQLKEFYVREAISYIERNYDHEISIEDIASFCNLNRSYFSKIFRDVVAVTPQEFLIRYRMAKACEYLETTDLPIGEISGKTGYPSALHFSRAFKHVFGIAPREWRQKHMHKSSAYVN